MPKKGYKQTPEHIAKRFTPESNAKIAATLTGYKQTPEHIANSIAAQNRPEVKIKHSASIIGPKHWNWRGGISKLPYAFEFDNKLKDQIRERDNYTCQKCNRPQSDFKETLTVHHIDYNKKNSDPVNLITLCISCNVKVNKNREYWTKYFQAMVIKCDITKLNRGFNSSQIFSCCFGILFL